MVAIAGPVAPPVRVWVAEANVNPLGNASLIATPVASPAPLFSNTIV